MELHDNAGHLARNQLLKKMNPHYFWEDMRSTVHNYTASCDICKRSKPSTQKPSGKLHEYAPDASQPCDLIQADFVGPIATPNGTRKHILTIVDAHTRFTVLYLCEQASAREVVTAIRNYSANFGRSNIFVSDSGPAFRSDELAKFLRELSIKQRHSSIYNPRSMGLVERTNQGIGTQLKLLTNRDIHWDENLDEIQYNLNNIHCETTNTTRFYAMFGRECRIPDGTGIEHAKAETQQQRIGHSQTT